MVMAARLSMTAALPMSFASLASSWLSSEIRSTAASIAELSSSTMSTRMTLARRRARPVAVTGSSRAAGISTAASAISWRNASSRRYAAQPVDRISEGVDQAAQAGLAFMRAQHHLGFPSFGKSRTCSLGNRAGLSVTNVSLPCHAPATCASCVTGLKHLFRTVHFRFAFETTGPCSRAWRRHDRKRVPRIDQARAHH